MHTLKLTLAYDGTNYAGWQVQRTRHQTSDIRLQQKPTVQGTLQQAFQRIVQEQVSVVGSGRTDAGVHALAQVAHVKLRAGISCGRLQHSLNSVLPPDIVVTHLTEAPAAFHARFDAVSKRYRYRIAIDPVVLPFERNYVHHVRAPLNLALMRREAATLLGRHDFLAFCKAGSSVKDARRRVLALELKRSNDELAIEIEATGFLHTMVRGIVGTLIDIGRGHRPPGTMARILRTKDRRLVGQTAPAKGLCLIGVQYRSG